MLLCQVNAPVTPAQCGHVQVSNGTGRREQCPLLAATAGRLWCAPPGHGFIAIPPEVGAQFFVSSRFDDVVYRGAHRGLHLAAPVVFDVAWETCTIDNLQGVMQGASMVQLLGMAHRDIPP